MNIGKTFLQGTESILGAGVKGAKKITKGVNKVIGDIYGKNKEAIQKAEKTMKAMNAQELSAQVKVNKGFVNTFNPDSFQTAVKVNKGFVNTFNPDSFQTATKQLVQEGIFKGQNADEAVNGARALMSATNMQEVSKSAKESAEAMKKAGAFDGIQYERAQELKEKYGAKLNAKKAKEAEKDALLNNLKKANAMLKDKEKFTPEQLDLRNKLTSF